MFVETISLNYKRKMQQMQDTNEKLINNLSKTTEIGLRQLADKAGM